MKPWRTLAAYILGAVAGTASMMLPPDSFVLRTLLLVAGLAGAAALAGYLSRTPTPIGGTA